MIPSPEADEVNSIGQGCPLGFFENPVCWFANLTTPNFRPGNQTTIDSLRNRLADEIPLDRAGLDQIEDSP